MIERMCATAEAFDLTATPEPRLDRKANSSPPPDSEHPEKRRHRLRRRAGAIMGEWHRTSWCGRRRIGGNVELWRKADGCAVYHGLATCGSIWTCPVCASKIAARRAGEVAELLHAHEAAGGTVYMATFTVRHGRWHLIGKLRGLLTSAWGALASSGPWQNIRAAYGLIGYIRAIEVTHGENGWHPHLHVLIFSARDLDAGEQAALADRLFDRWARMVERRGGEALREAFDFTRATNSAAAAEYVAKWGAACEISKAAAKIGRGSRSPWQLLEAADRGSREAAKLFRKYAKAFKGARHLTYSHGLRERYECCAEIADAEAADDALDLDETSTRMATFEPWQWREIVRHKLTGDVLVAAKEGGFEAVHGLLQDHGISPPSRPPPQAGCAVKPPPGRLHGRIPPGELADYLSPKGGHHGHQTEGIGSRNQAAN